MRIRLFVLMLVCLAAGFVQAADERPANVGHIDVRSSLVGGRVYIDDVYSGDADVFIEDVPAGEHSVAIRHSGQVIRGQFILKSGETLMLEGRFDENRLVDLKEVAREEAMKRADAERKAEAERKAAEAEHKKKEAVATATAKAKVEEKKKPEAKKTAPVEAKRAAKSAEEERRELHLNIIRVDFEDTGVYDLKVTSKINTKVITNFNDGKSIGGKLIRKQNYLLCEAAPCYRDWTGRFFYIDEAGKRDAFLIRHKENVFTGVTPQGTSKLDMDVCLNGDCKRVAFPAEGAGAVQSRIDRYVLSWSKNAFTIRRADIMKEITDSGGKIPEF
jgi:nucleoid-associated protein YgaU